MTALLLCLTGCPFTLPAHKQPPRATDESGTVKLAAASARRLLVTRDESQSRSRLVAVWLQIENAGSDPLAFDPDNVTLTFADGTSGVTLDRARADVLIDRLEVAPTDEAVADFPDEWTQARRTFMQPSLKRQLKDGLLSERSLSTEVMEGYLLFDSRQRAASFDGAVLQIVLLRESDGAQLRQLYRFASSQAQSAPAAQR